MRQVLLLFWAVFALGQSTSSPPESQAQPPAGSSGQNQDFGLGKGAKGTQMGPFEILSDTKGVDFKPYLKRVVEIVRQNWYLLIPESAETKKGKLVIEMDIAAARKTNLSISSAALLFFTFSAIVPPPRARKGIAVTCWTPISSVDFF